MVKKQNGLKCVKCGDEIFSDFRRDFKFCKCGEVHIDGGFDYFKFGFVTTMPIKIVRDVKFKKIKGSKK